MGLLEQIQSGALFTRQSQVLSSTDVSGSVSSFGNSYILLGMSATNPCRVRLYSDSASVNIDDSRPATSADFSASVGLTLDATLTSDQLTLTFDPPILGTTFKDTETWYNISASSATNVTLNYYPIEQLTGSREEIVIRQFATANNFIHEGTFTAPKSFLLLSASADTLSRLRLYSVDSGISTAEKLRNTGSLPSDNSKLIIDMLFDSASYPYKLAPIIEGFNINSYPVGTNTYSYIMQNRTGTNAPITASLYIYPLET
jgi:hypothetical protein